MVSPQGMTTWTLGAVKERNLSFEGHCQTEQCGHFFVFDVDSLISSAGPDYVIPEFVPGVACTQCGGQLKVKFGMDNFTLPLDQGSKDTVR